MVHFAGCKPIFCDIHPRTFTIDVEDAKKRLTERTKAIAAVHLFGNACDIEQIKDFAHKHRLKIIWDAAQAHGTKYKGRNVGSFDDLVCYSFYPTKNMTTGEGGIITTNDSDLAEKCMLLRSHWQAQKYYHPNLGFNYRMTNVEAAIGLMQVQKLDAFITKRRQNASDLTESLSQMEGIIPPFVAKEVEHSYHQYTILLELNKLNCTRDEFVNALKKEGIGTGVHYPKPLHKQPAFEKMLGNNTLPVSETVSKRVLSLPVYPALEKDDIGSIIQGVEKVISQAIDR